MTTQIDFLSSEIQNLVWTNRNMLFAIRAMAHRIEQLENCCGRMQPSAAASAEPVPEGPPAADTFRQIDHCKAVYIGIEDAKAHLGSHEEACAYALANGYSAFTHSNRAGSNAYYYFKRNRSRLTLESNSPATKHTSWVIVDRVQEPEVVPVAEQNPIVGQFRLIPRCRAINDTEDARERFGSDEEAFAYALANGYKVITHTNRVGSNAYYRFKRNHARLSLVSAPECSGSVSTLPNGYSTWVLNV